jgi:hypothetical protein
VSAYYDSLVTRRDNIAAQLAAIVIDTPSYSIDGQSVKSLSEQLTNQLESVNQLIAHADGNDSFQIYSVADTD